MNEPGNHDLVVLQQALGHLKALREEMLQLVMGDGPFGPRPFPAASKIQCWADTLDTAIADLHLMQPREEEKP